MSARIPPPPQWAKPDSPAWLDWYTTIANIIEDTDGVAHDHANMSVLNNTTESFTTALKAQLNQQASADQAAVTIGNTNNEIGGLTISAAYAQAEVQALRDKCEELGDDVRALSTLIHSLRTVLITAGLAKGSA